MLLAIGGSGEFAGPKGVALDPASGRIYVADTGNARVVRLAPDGTVESTIALPLPASAVTPTVTAVPATPVPTTTPTPVPG